MLEVLTELFWYFAESWINREDQYHSHILTLNISLQPAVCLLSLALRPKAGASLALPQGKKSFITSRYRFNLEKVKKRLKDICLTLPPSSWAATLVGGAWAVESLPTSVQLPAAPGRGRIFSPHSLHLLSEPEGKGGEERKISLRPTSPGQ